MDNIHNNISNYSSGKVYDITSNNYLYTFIINKGSANYYSLIMICYYSFAIYYFYYHNGNKQIKIFY